ncbi:hypothetical protein THASP1DRAFT_33108 [Thamnocephalis sphaerospora]|uniref:Uncharacterized protein n=1 Tax=Thamnocephalis sphaerospora TaxID=78915 RepID=A0A4V1IVS3_9FUNG|nr:hypothetical protein THASP1DRAFT_33108 [Thamnocephalis sphaerospora]|eukprot:RKP05059.1 hypothetical protein THASP1DRAFT_33108 [Thamnocephalis sphaerospora]
MEAFDDDDDEEMEEEEEEHAASSDEEKAPAKQAVLPKKRVKVALAPTKLKAGRKRPRK